MSNCRADSDNTKGKIYDFPEIIDRRESIATHLSIHEKNGLIMKNRVSGRKLACSMLRKWNCRLELEDVDSIVDLSLCEAVKYFDPNKGVNFLTFLFYHLRGNLIRTIKTQANQTAIPLEFSDENMESGFIGHERINTADAFETFGTTQKSPDQQLQEGQFVELTKLACQKLTDLEREIIVNVFMHEEQVTQLAQDLNYSRCHISRLKTATINKLRSEIEKITGEKIAVNEDNSEPRRKLDPSRHRVRNLKVRKSKKIAA